MKQTVSYALLYPRWSPAEEALLRQRWEAIRLASPDSKSALASAGVLLGRTANAVRERVLALGFALTVCRVRLGRKAQTKTVRVLARGPRAASEAAERTNRGWHAISAWREGDKRLLRGGGNLRGVTGRGG
jgi:hypothetical protein